MSLIGQISVWAKMAKEAKYILCLTVKIISTDSSFSAKKKKSKKATENCHSAEEQTEGDVASSHLGEAKLVSHQ